MTTDNTINVVEVDETNPTALYLRYPGQGPAQGVYIQLDLRDGELTANAEVEVGNSFSRSARDGVVRQWTLPYVPTAEGANTLLHALVPLAERVLAGSTVESDDVNQVGYLNDAADAAESKILRYLEVVEYSQVQQMDASKWWSEGGLPEGLIDATDDQVSAIAAEHESDAATSDPGAHTVLIGAEEYLLGRREELRNEVREQLRMVAGQHRDLKTRQSAWGDRDAAAQAAQWRQVAHGLIEAADLRGAIDSFLGLQDHARCRVGRPYRGHVMSETDCDMARYLHEQATEQIAQLQAGADYLAAALGDAGEEWA